MRYILCLTILVFLITESQARSEEIGIEMAEVFQLFAEEGMVVTASRIEEPLSVIPASVNVVTDEDIRTKQSLTVNEAVGTVPGLAIQTIGSPADPYTGISIRGTNSYQSVFMIDGIKINSPFNQRTFGVLLLGNAEKIEVVKGSYSALYGSEAIGGIVNVITAERPGLSYFLRGGTYRTSNAGVLYSNRHEDISYTLGYENFSAEGFKFSGPYWNHNLIGKIAFPVGASSSLHLLTGYWNWKKFDRTICCEIDESGNYAVIIDPDSNTKERIWLNSIQWTHYPSDRWDYSLRLSRYTADNLSEDILEQATPGRPFPLEFYQNIRSERDIFEMQNNFYFSEKNIVTFGFLLTSEKVKMEEFGNVFSSGMEPSVAQPGFDSERVSRAVYLQNLFKVRDRFSLTAGAWVEDGPGFDGKFIPKVSALYKVPLTETTILISYGQGIRVPTLRELSQNANLELTPDKSASMEAGFKQPLIEEKIWFEATGFILWFNDLIEFSDDLTNPLTNIGRAKIKGVEASFKADVTKKLRGSIGYTRLLTENSDTGEDLPFRPHYRWTAEVRYHPVARLTVELNAEFVGESFDNSYYFYDLDGQPISSRKESYQIVNVAAAYNLIKRDPVFGALDFTMKLSNIFDEEYKVFLDFRNAGYTFLAGIRLTH